LVLNQRGEKVKTVSALHSVGSPVNSSAHRLLNGLHHLHGALDLVVQRVAFVQTFMLEEVAFLDLFASPPATFDATRRTLFGKVSLVPLSRD
jgi:hypothetical protein